MFWDFIHLIADEVNKYNHFASRPLPISPRKQIIFNSNFSRIIISAVTIWILAAGILILTEGFKFLDVIGVIADSGLIIISIVTITFLWRYPQIAHRILIPISILITACSVILFILLLKSLSQAKGSELRIEFLWAYGFLIPSAIIFFCCVLVGRRHIYLASFVDRFTDEVPELESPKDDSQS